MVNSIGLLEPCLCVNIFQLVLRHNPIRTLFWVKLSIKSVFFLKVQLNLCSKFHF